jgi:hypothetical protein
MFNCKQVEECSDCRSRWQECHDEGQMALIAELITKWGQSEDKMTCKQCESRFQRLLSALAVAGSHDAQEVLSNFISHQRQLDLSGRSPCFQQSVEVTHLVANPSERLFDSIHSLASELANPEEGQHGLGISAMLALGSLGRSSQQSSVANVANSPHVSLSARASDLLTLKFQQAMDMNHAEQRRQRMRTRLLQSFERSSPNFREHVLASTRSLSRY